ncbi:Asp-tRNAAsn/Glu-tRNAGln amidotransferase A subunit [Sphingomonas sp. NFR04]|uniref:amidase n=1 Tax=Sphingomonas sp. NFR04 TaxID=1566283 RepID=UPI0008EA5E3D|nr:amidase [Sphingomonas sp. NFR04]SFK06806.1 Asp-tRNAAsn/Glu-tRNAGln amidotransferase A subunit [Sphingomonas sp. NFR04]
MTTAEPTIATLASHLASGQLRARDLLDACLVAIAARDGNLHAMLAMNLDARAEADAADRAAAQGRSLGPLHGIPIVVKDNIDVAGMPTTSGCIGLRGAMPVGDANVVSRLRAAGAVLVGKTNLSELSFEIRSRSSLGGDVLHPLNLEVTPGGSSGGTAVAVACGFAVAGLGTDTGGSLRIPAAYTGLVGFRPAQYALPMNGIAPLAPATDTVGPIARSVDDVALLLAALGLRFAAAPDRQPRIGILRQAFGSDRAISAALAPAIDALARSDVQIIDPVALPDALLPISGDHIVDAQFADAFDGYLATNFVPGTAPATLSALVKSGAHLPDYAPQLRARLARKGGATATILAEHARLRDAMVHLLNEKQVDLLLFPTSQVVPRSLENPKGGWAPELAARSGWPALSVPSGEQIDGMPVGVELIGPPGCETMLFAAARQIEARGR